MTKKPDKPAPLVISDEGAPADTRQKLHLCIIKFYKGTTIKFSPTKITIYPADSRSKQKLIKQINEAKFQYHTYATNSEKEKKLAIKASHP